MKLEDLESIMDEARFVAFLRHFGGLRIYIPKMIKADHPIAEVVGLDTATLLSDLYQGESVDLPTLDRHDRRLKRRKILELSKQNKSFNQIALECGCSRRYAVQVCADGREEIEAERVEPRFRQLELF